MAFYTFVQGENVPYLIENDDKVVLNWNHLDNNFNANNPALRRNSFHFSPDFLSGEFCFGLLSISDGGFYQLSMPAAELFPSSRERFGQSSVFVSVQSFDFPKYVEEKFQSIKGYDSFPDKRLLLLFLQKTCD